MPFGDGATEEVYGTLIDRSEYDAAIARRKSLLMQEPVEKKPKKRRQAQRQVIEREAPAQSFVNADCLSWMRMQPDRSVDFVFGSPPYEDARKYGALTYVTKGQDWVNWMVSVVVEACRISNGMSMFVMSGKVKDCSYSPVVEWLVADLTRLHGVCCSPSPYVFERSGIAGSGGPYFHRRNWEPVYGFAYPDRLPPSWTDNLATGSPPKYSKGGKFSHQTSDGKLADGKEYPQLEIANAGNVVKCIVGGGHMGDPLAHENEAPFPESLVEFFVKSFCQPEGIVYDPFSGSGTTVAVAKKLGRYGIGTDIREEQVAVGVKRCESVQLQIVEQTNDQSEFGEDDESGCEAGDGVPGQGIVSV